MLHSRPFCLALTLGLAYLSALGCTPAPQPKPVERAPSPPPPQPPVEHWPRFTESLQWPTSTENWFISEGHYAGTSEALVHVTPEALEQYRGHARGARFEPGTSIVMLHRKRSNRTPGPVHVMVRGSKDWEYLVLDASGAVELRGELPLCQRCHSEAVSDSVFGAAVPDGPE